MNGGKNNEKIKNVAKILMIVSGIFSILYTYNMFTGIDDDMYDCAKSDKAYEKLNMQYLFFLVAGIILIILTKFVKQIKKKNKDVNDSLMIIGIFLISYALNIKFYQFDVNIKTFVSWLFFAGSTYFTMKYK